MQCQRRRTTTQSHRPTLTWSHRFAPPKLTLKIPLIWPRKLSQFFAEDVSKPNALLKNKIKISSYFFVVEIILFSLPVVLSTVCLGISLILPIAMLVIGFIHKERCQVQPMIPTYLIVGGIVCIVNALLKFASNMIGCAS